MQKTLHLIKVKVYFQKKKTKINNKIECIGLIIPITKVAHVKQQQHKKKKKNSIYKSG